MDTNAHIFVTDKLDTLLYSLKIQRIHRKAQKHKYINTKGSKFIRRNDFCTLKIFVNEFKHKCYILNL